MTNSCVGLHLTVGKANEADTDFIYFTETGFTACFVFSLNIDETQTSFCILI